MILAAAGAALLSGCAATVALEPAPDAVNPGCAEIMVRLPQSLPNDANNDKRETNAQATAAWGDPASVLLRCGITPTGPTTLPCININGIDWIEDDSGAPNYRFITYGRVPTTEVIINNNVVSGTSTLVDLTGVISNIPQTSVCLDVKDVPALPTSTPVPSP
jgi:hypothetical protein